MNDANRPFIQNAPPVSGRLILLADGSDQRRMELAGMMRAAGHRVIEAARQDQAQALCIQRRPDIVIADRDLPGPPDGAGFALCRWFRSLRARGDSYFILLTTAGCDQDIAQGLRAGADEFLAAPVCRAELAARLGTAERILTMGRQIRDCGAALQRADDRLLDTRSAIERDLREARALQRRLLREGSEIWGDFRLSLMLRPAGHIGGDMVGFFALDGQRVGIYAMDVAGHGFTSALLTARLAARFGKGPGAVPSPGDFVRSLNRQLLDDLRVDSYYTLVYGDLDCMDGGLRLVQAGHPHPFMQRADGRIERVGHGGLPIGILPDAAFEELRLRLDPGDRLLIASDGVAECESPAGLPLGEDGIRAILRDNAALGGNAFLDTLTRRLSDHAHGRRRDDISALLIERRGPPR